MLIRQNSKILLNKIHKFFQSNLKEFPKIFAKVRKKSESAKMGEKRGAECYGTKAFQPSEGG